MLSTWSTLELFGYRPAASAWRASAATAAAMAVERTMAAMYGVQGLGEREGSSTARRPVRAYVEVAHIVFFEARVASTVLHSSCTPRRAKQGSGMYDIRLSLYHSSPHTPTESPAPPLPSSLTTPWLIPCPRSSRQPRSRPSSSARTSWSPTSHSSPTGVRVELPSPCTPRLTRASSVLRDSEDHQSWSSHGRSGMHRLHHESDGQARADQGRQPQRRRPVRRNRSSSILRTICPDHLRQRREGHGCKQCHQEHCRYATGCGHLPRNPHHLEEGPRARNQVQAEVCKISCRAHPQSHPKWRRPEPHEPSP